MEKEKTLLAESSTLSDDGCLPPDEEQLDAHVVVKIIKEKLAKGETLSEYEKEFWYGEIPQDVAVAGF
jgi:hypothetical protein